MILKRRVHRFSAVHLALLSLGTSLLLLLSLFASPLAAQERAPNQVGASAVDLAFSQGLAEHLGISVLEATERIALQPAVSGLQNIARARYPDTFAGLEVDHSQGGRIVLSFTRDTNASVAELRRRSPAKT